MFNTANYHTETIFCNMCRVAKVDYLNIDRTKDNWYMMGDWTQEEEEKFSRWMVEYIYKIPSVQKELYGTRNMKKDTCIQAVQMFLLSFGWKRKKVI